MTEPQFAHAMHREGAQTVVLPASPGGSGGTRSRQGLSRRALQRACDYMAMNMGESLTLDDVAGAAAISRFHFARSFKASTGESPMAYLRRARIERAMQLLRRGGRPIAEIAVAVGFYDQSHFSRNFRQMVGATPARYARVLSISRAGTASREVVAATEPGPGSGENDEQSRAIASRQPKAWSSLMMDCPRPCRSIPRRRVNGPLTRTRETGEPMADGTQTMSHGRSSAGPGISRRGVLRGGAAAVAAAGLSVTMMPAGAIAAVTAGPNQDLGEDSMDTIATKDGTRIYYKDWGGGPTVVLSHGWPLSSDSWEAQMLFLASKGYRCIAHDRRGHGRSSQPWNGNEMNTYADDLAQLMETLDLKDAVMIGFSTGGGEVARYIGRHGTKRVAKAVLVSSVPPLMLKTPANPGGLPVAVFDGLRAGSIADRSQLYKDLAAGPFFGFNRPGAKVSQGMIDSFWLQGMQAGHKNTYDCIKAFSETDFTEDLKKFDVPTLVIHGDDDQVVPIDAAGRACAKLVSGATLKVYAGAPHGITDTHKDQLNEDLLAFLKT